MPSLKYMVQQAKSATYVETLKKLLDEFEVGGETLATVLDPAISTCAKLAKNKNDFVTCLREIADTLKQTASKVK
ncbi:MAG: hypothetical protein QXG48_02200 [Thermofilaceae archaeon]